MKTRPTAGYACSLHIAAAAAAAANEGKVYGVAYPLRTPSTRLSIKKDPRMISGTK